MRGCAVNRVAHHRDARGFSFYPSRLQWAERARHLPSRTAFAGSAGHSRSVVDGSIRGAVVGARAPWHSGIRGAVGRRPAILATHLPARLAEQLMKEIGVPGDRRTSSLRRPERTALIESSHPTSFRGPATKATRKPKSPAAGSRWTKSTRRRSRAGAARACICAARSSTSSARSAATTSHGRGPPAARPDWRQAPS